MQGLQPPRPLTHDLLSTVIEVLDHRIDRVTITELRDHVFMAELSLVDSDGVTTSLSCRPSDVCACNPHGCTDLCHRRGAGNSWAARTFVCR